jgi:hypothetical protein
VKVLKALKLFRIVSRGGHSEQVNANNFWVVKRRWLFQWCSCGLWWHWKISAIGMAVFPYNLISLLWGQTILVLWPFISRFADFTDPGRTLTGSCNLTDCSSYTFQHWKRRQDILPKRLFQPIRLHSVTAQNYSVKKQWNLEFIRKRICMIWGSYSSGYEKFYFLSYNVLRQPG